MKTIDISGVIGWDVTPWEIREQLLAAKGEDVTFIISGPGGFIAPGLEIFNMIRNYAGATTAHISGYAMSMASYIPLAADRRVAEDNSVFMIHNAGGGIVGDHNDILKYGNYLKGLSGIIAKQYIKSTGKSLKEITAWMDAETFFFGDEMVKAGFVDEIIETEGDKNQDTALASARAMFEDASARMSAEPDQCREDMTRAAALLEYKLPQDTNKLKVNQQQEEQHMSLKEFLADNPGAKAEFDAAISVAKAEGKDVGTAEMSATIKKVGPYLSSKEYPPVIMQTALNVLNGEDAMATLIGAVAGADAAKEAADSAAALLVKEKETNGQHMDPETNDGMIGSQEELDAAVAQHRKGV